MNNENESRTQGVEFGELADELEKATYPMDKAEVVERFGDHELGLEDRDETVRSVLGPMGETTYESRDEVEQSILTMVGDDAVGRENYSDRGGPAQDAGDDDESV